MDLDNARNAKAEIFRNAFNYAELASASAADILPKFVPLEQSAIRRAARTGRFEWDRRLEIAVGIAPPPMDVRPSGAGNRSGYEIILFGQRKALQDSSIVQKAQRITSGEVRFVYTGPVRRQSIWSPAIRRPLEPGTSTGHYRVTAGTLGGFFDIRGRGICMASNNHVLADTNRGRAGDAILQPSRLDKGVRSKDTVGFLLDFEPITFASDGINTMDCAVATIGHNILPGDSYPPECGAPAQICGSRNSPLDIDDEVFKIGRTTGLTRGIVFAIEVDQLIVNMGALNSPRLARFDNQLQVYSQTGHFSKGGDSGSFVVDMDGKVGGLLFAGSTRGAPSGFGLTSVNPIEPILDRFNAKIWTA